MALRNSLIEMMPSPFVSHSYYNVESKNWYIELHCENVSKVHSWSGSHWLKNCKHRIKQWQNKINQQKVTNIFPDHCQCLSLTVSIPAQTGQPKKIFTDRVRSTREGNVFSLSTPRGIPEPGPAGGGGYPNQVQPGGEWYPGGYSSRGVPWWGVPHLG